VIAEIPGARIWYEDSGGSGVPVVFLHAGTGSCAMWQHQQAAFAAAGYRFLACDRRGHGKTEAAAYDVPPSEDLHRFVEKLGLGKLHLVGTAAGGIVALDYALSHGENLRSLVIANSIGGAQDPDYLELQRRLRPAPYFEALPVDLRELGPSYRAANPDGVKRWLEIERTSRHKGIEKMPAARNRITFDALSSIRTPTLFLGGDGDLYAPPPVLELYRAKIPGAKSVVLPACGHTAFWEQPALFNAEVLAFIGKH
jgi:pimeloyl-ACP methyl ester carboxylesterase